MARRQPKTVQLKVRLKEPLRARIEASAKRHGTSLNAEAVARLEGSFQREEAMADQWGGLAPLQVWIACAAAANALAAKNEADWLDDPKTAKQVKLATKMLLDLLGPEGPVPAKEIVKPGNMAVAYSLRRIASDIDGLGMPDAEDQRSEMEPTINKAAKTFRGMV